MSFGKIADVEMVILDEDDLASIFGRFAMASIFCSEIRQIWMLSWPLKAILFLSQHQHLRAQALQHLFRDYDLYKKLKAKEGRLPQEDLILQRSVFNLTGVMQIVHALELNGRKVFFVFVCGRGVWESGEGM